MKLLANGCSMTHGQELVTDGYDPRNTKLCYAHKIFKHFGLFDEYINVAMPGVSNQHIVESTMDYLLTQDASNTFVLIGWSSPIRYSFTHNNHYLRFNIHQPPHHGETMAGPNVTEFHKQFRLHMNDEHDLARHFFHQVNYLATYLQYAGVPYAMSYFFEEPGYSQSRRRTVTPHWPQRSNEPMMHVFGTPDPKYLHRYNILPGAHWHALQVLQRARKETLYASNRHPNELGHELIAQRLYPIIEKALNTI
tara:strand:- start:670 stop:1422 length:753 start_codon:yes stop_codon:yes gene_type:complete